jgi:hypothetical protein
VGTVFAQFVQMLALSLGFKLATSLPSGGSGLLQPLLGIAVLAIGLKIPGLMGGGHAGGNVVGSALGAATGAVVGGGASRAVSGAFGSAWATAAGWSASTADPHEHKLPAGMDLRHSGHQNSAEGWKPVSRYA